MKRRGWDEKRTYNEYTLFPNTVNTLFQVRLSQIVIPDLIREPVVFRHVVGLRVYSSGSRIKSGMTISECLT